MAKVVVKVPVGFPVCQVEVPEAVPSGKKDEKGKPEMVKVERSRKGSIHLRPDSTIILTEAELDVIKNWDKKLHRRLVVTVQKEQLAKSQEKAKKEEAPEPPASKKAAKGKAKAQPKATPKAIEATEEKPQGKDAPKQKA